MSRKGNRLIIDDHRNRTRDTQETPLRIQVLDPYYEWVSLSNLLPLWTAGWKVLAAYSDLIKAYSVPIGQAFLFHANICGFVLLFLEVCFRLLNSFLLVVPLNLRIYLPVLLLKHWSAKKAEVYWKISYTWFNVVSLSHDTNGYPWAQTSLCKKGEIICTLQMS